MRYCKKIIWLIVFLCGSVAAQEGSSSKLSRSNFDKRPNLTPVELDENQIQAYKNDNDFNYSRQLDTVNWWEAFTDWLSYIWKSFWQNLFGDIQAGSWLATVLSVLKYVLIAGIVVLVVWLFIKLNPGRAFMKPQDSPEVILSEDEEIIRDKDIPGLIERALTKGDYRLAIRYYYLLMLKLLKDYELIDYQYEKTNREYRQEISNPLTAERFQQLTRLYDFTWYGDFSVNQQQFSQAKQQFLAFQNHLNHRDNA